MTSASAIGSPLYGAVDIGGTKIAIGITDSNGRILVSVQIRTGHDPHQAVSAIAEALTAMLPKAEAIISSDSFGCRQDFSKASFSEPRTTACACFNRLSGIGISCAGPVDIKTGSVHNPYTLPGWENFPLAKSLFNVTGVPIRLENDANCTLLGELLLSAGLKENETGRSTHGASDSNPPEHSAQTQNLLPNKRIFMACIGTGIGCAFWDGSSLYRGGERFHPELGHIRIPTKRAPIDCCYCGHNDCAEHLFSGTALHSRAKKAGFHSFTELAEAAASRADLRKPAADLFLQDVRTEFCAFLWNVALLFHPNEIVLGGGIADAYFPLFQHFSQSFFSIADQRACSLSDFTPPFQLSKAAAGSNTALSGAAALFLV